MVTKSTTLAKSDWQHIGRLADEYMLRPMWVVVFLGIAPSRNLERPGLTALSRVPHFSRSLREVGTTDMSSIGFLDNDANSCTLDATSH